MIYDCCKKSTRVAFARGKQPLHVNESLSKQIMLFSMTDNSCSNVNTSHVAWTISNQGDCYNHMEISLS